MTCPAETALKRLEDGKPLTQRQMLQIEVVLSKCTQTCKRLHESSERRIRALKTEMDALDDPTSQEQDKRRMWWTRRL